MVQCLAIERTGGNVHLVSAEEGGQLAFIGFVCVVAGIFINEKRQFVHCLASFSIVVEIKLLHEFVGVFSKIPSRHHELCREWCVMPLEHVEVTAGELVVIFCHTRKRQWSCIIIGHEAQP